MKKTEHYPISTRFGEEMHCSCLLELPRSRGCRFDLTHPPGRPHSTWGRGGRAPPAVCIAIGLTSGSPCHPHNHATTCTTFFFLPISTTPHLSFSPSRPAPPPPPSPDDPSLRCRCAAATNSSKYVRSPLFFPSPTASPYGGGSEPIGCCRPELVRSLDLMSDLDS